MPGMQVAKLVRCHYMHKCYTALHSSLFLWCRNPREAASSTEEVVLRIRLKEIAMGVAKIVGHVGIFLLEVLTHSLDPCLAI